MKGIYLSNPVSPRSMCDDENETMFVSDEDSLSPNYEVNRLSDKIDELTLLVEGLTIAHMNLHKRLDDMESDVSLKLSGKKSKVYDTLHEQVRRQNSILHSLVNQLYPDSIEESTKLKEPPQRKTVSINSSSKPSVTNKKYLATPEVFVEGKIVALKNSYEVALNELMITPEFC